VTSRSPPPRPPPASPPASRARPAHVRSALPGLPDDSTRVATFLLANEGSNRTSPISRSRRVTQPVASSREEGHPGEDRPDRPVVHAAIRRFLERLDEAKDIDGNSLLHNSMIVYGSGNGDGNRHNTTICPSSSPVVGAVPCRPVATSSSSPSDEQPVPQPARSHRRLRRGTPRRLDRTDRGDLRAN